MIVFAFVIIPNFQLVERLPPDWFFLPLLPHCKSYQILPHEYCERVYASLTPPPTLILHWMADLIPVLMKDFHELRWQVVILLRGVCCRGSGSIILGGGVN